MTIAEKKTLFGIGVFRLASFTERMQIPPPGLPLAFRLGTMGGSVGLIILGSCFLEEISCIV